MTKVVPLRFSIVPSLICSITFFPTSCILKSVSSRACCNLLICFFSINHLLRNSISLLFNSQYQQLNNPEECFHIEPIMSNASCKNIESEYSYLKNITPITERKDGSYKEDFEAEDDLPLNSEVKNPFKYFLNAKVKYHISKKQFDEVQEVLKTRYFKPTKSDRVYLLSGLIKCSKCGGFLYGSTGYGYKDGKKGTQGTGGGPDQLTLAA